LYDWFVEALGIYAPRQIEFARLNLTYTLMSKRRLLSLVEEGHVTGWDDPRMPTIAGMRRRGYTPEAIRHFCATIGVTKHNSLTDVALLEHCLRDDLNKRAPRIMAVLHPLKVVITNFPEGHVEEIESVNNPEDPGAGSRLVPFSRELYIEQDDFREVPPKKYFRLSPGKEVRLRWGYYIKCEEVVKDEAGNIVELRCTYDPQTRGGWSPDGRKVQATIHWVSAAHAVPAKVRLYDRLFLKEDMNALAEGEDWRASLNPESLTEGQALVEPSIKQASPGGLPFQFERQGYFYLDPIDSQPGKPVFNRTVTLRDSWAKIEKKS
ncbi:MAG: glutamate--tRNA ligase family protein, partial [Planctomycetota bacterium]